MHKHLWFDLRKLPIHDEGEASACAERVNSSAVETVFVDAAQLVQSWTWDFGKKINVFCFVESEAQYLGLGDAGSRVHGFISDDETVLQMIQSHSAAPIGLFVHVVDQITLDLAWQRGIHYDYLIIDFRDPTNIPLELVIARMKEHLSSTILLKIVSSIEDAKIAFEVLERGSDGIVLSGDSLDEIDDMDQILTSSEKVQLEEVIVDSIQYIGMGDRGCIDTVILMTQDEGMIIGSTSSGGILVCSETHYLPYMELRPFRVNAGGVHSYVLGPNNTTSYISELSAGKQVLCVNSDGTTRLAPVGRVKTERRPLLLIKGTIGTTEVNAILQDDWHVRVMGFDGKAQNITELKQGDRLLGCLMKSGRHVGIQVSETINEK